MFDKGKPVERRGRKAMDLPSRACVTMTARPPKTDPQGDAGLA